MLTRALDLVPNTFAACRIGFVGFVVARVLRTVVVNLLSAAGAVGLSERMGPEPSVSLSNMAGRPVFLLVIVPSLIAALDALKIEAISRPATQVPSTMLGACRTWWRQRRSFW
jgi:hypothetical protein